MIVLNNTIVSNFLRFVHFSFSIAASAGEVVVIEHLGFAGLTYMQDMTSSACAKEEIGATRKLIDIRDNKTYWVSKLNDGNCWMTQNLDLDLEGVTLYPETSDVLESWESTTGKSTTWQHDSSVEAENLARYYDPGNYVLGTPNFQRLPTCDGFTSAECLAIGVRNVDGLAASNLLNSNFVADEKSYNAHFLIGNYYSWGAATAGYNLKLVTGSELPQDSLQSICPKGWTLPITSYSPNWSSTSKSFAHLFDSYGAYNDEDVSFGGQRVYEAPLYFVYGSIVFRSSSITDIGNAGYYHNATTRIAIESQDLIISIGTIKETNTKISTVASNDRRYGDSIRCVAR